MERRTQPPPGFAKRGTQQDADKSSACTRASSASAAPSASGTGFPPHLAYSERTPSVPRCQYPRAMSAAGGRVLLTAGASAGQLGLLLPFGFPALRLLAELLGERFDPLGHRLLLIEVLLEKLGRIPLSQIFCHLDEPGVHHHLVVLSFLRAADVRHLQHLWRGILPVKCLMFVGQPFDAEAGRLLGLLADLLEDFLEILDLPYCLLLVLL